MENEKKVTARYRQGDCEQRVCLYLQYPAMRRTFNEIEQMLYLKGQEGGAFADESRRRGRWLKGVKKLICFCSALL